MVEFTNIHQRDLALSHAAHLPPGSSIDIVIPDHLLQLQRHLNHFGYRFRKHARETRNEKIFTSVRLDDDTNSLQLAVRPKKDKPWKYYSRKELRELDDNMEKLPNPPMVSEDEEDDPMQ